MNANPNSCTRTGARQFRILTEVFHENTNHTCIEKCPLIFVTRRCAQIRHGKAYSITLRLRRNLPISRQLRRDTSGGVNEARHDLRVERRNNGNVNSRHSPLYRAPHFAVPVLSARWRCPLSNLEVARFHSTTSPINTPLSIFMCCIRLLLGSEDKTRSIQGHR